MSRGMRTVLGGFLALCAAGLLALAPLLGGTTPQAGPIMVLLAALCGIGAIARFSTGNHPVTIRILGGVLFAGCLAYGIGQTVAAPGVAREVAGGLRRSRPGLVNSLILMVLVGLPSGCAAFFGRYPGWGAHAGAFGGGKTRKAKMGPSPTPGAHPARTRPGGEF